MQVLEYPETVKLPSYQNTAYISYIESIPMYHCDGCLASATGGECSSAKECNGERSAITKALFCGYLGYLHRRKFKQVCLWAMPPLESAINYIFHMRQHRGEMSLDNLAQRQRLLEKWYVARLEDAKAAGAVESFTDNTSASHNNSAAVLFNFEQQHSARQQGVAVGTETDAILAARLAREGSAQGRRKRKKVAPTSHAPPPPY